MKGRRSLGDVLTGIRRRKGMPALMTHVVLGYPSLKESIEIVRVMADSGASLIELQIPFSDPFGDGPTITEANSTALAQGVTPRACIRAMRTLSKAVDVPLLFMSYFNPVLSYPGQVEGFVGDAARAGAWGLIVPDVPPEERSEGYWKLTRAHGLVPVPLVSPTTPMQRLRQIAKAAGQDGFVYCVSATAVTGARRKLPEELPGYLRKVRRAFRIPLAVGFGISKPEHIRALEGLADIAIVGSATIDLIKRTPRGKRRKELAGYIKRLTGKR